MAASLRVVRRRIRSVQSTKKITRAMELIAASRIAKAQQRVEESKPYAEEITRVIGAVTGQGNLDHPLVTEREEVRQAAVIVITSDRGLAGPYNANVLREADTLRRRLARDGKKPLLYVIGRKGVSFFKFRDLQPEATFTGFSEKPTYEDAKNAADAVLDEYLRAHDDDTEGEGELDEIHLVYTVFHSAMTQKATSKRILPIDLDDIEERDDDEGDDGDGDRSEGRSDGPKAQYEFEPSAEGVLDALLPRYVESQVYAALLESAASESAARRNAMKAATDNAEDIINSLTRQANAARQAEITQELSEIVAGADALASSGSE